MGGDRPPPLRVRLHEDRPRDLRPALALLPGQLRHGGGPRPLARPGRVGAAADPPDVLRPQRLPRVRQPAEDAGPPVLPPATRDKALPRPRRGDRPVGAPDRPIGHRPRPRRLLHVEDVLRVLRQRRRVGAVRPPGRVPRQPAPRRQHVAVDGALRARVLRGDIGGQRRGAVREGADDGGRPGGRDGGRVRPRDARRRAQRPGRWHPRAGADPVLPVGHPRLQGAGEAALRRPDRAPLPRRLRADAEVRRDRLPRAGPDGLRDRVPRPARPAEEPGRHLRRLLLRHLPLRGTHPADRRGAARVRERVGDQRGRRPALHAPLRGPVVAPRREAVPVREAPREAEEPSAAGARPPGGAAAPAGAGLSGDPA